MDYKSKKTVTPSSIEKFWFIDDIVESLGTYSVKNNTSLRLVYTNYKYHAEIHSIVVEGQNDSRPFLELFSDYSLLIIPEQEQIKVFVTAKEKLDSGSHRIDGMMADFRKFLKNHVSFVQGSFKQVLFLD